MSVPYRAVGSIGVFGMHSPNHSASCCIFLDFVDVTWGQEHGGLVRIFHCDLNCHSVLKRPVADELRVNVHVGCLNFQAVCSFGFKIYRLARKKT